MEGSLVLDDPVTYSGHLLRSGGGGLVESPTSAKEFCLARNYTIMIGMAPAQG